LPVRSQHARAAGRPASSRLDGRLVAALRRRSSGSPRASSL
jgi:hypothetical protein